MAASALAQPVTWKAGAAKVVITPAQPMWMSGYANRTAPADGKETELWAKAIALEDGAGHKSVLITLDLVGIPRDLSIDVCKRIMDKHKLGREQIAIACSHTHCGPVVGGNLQTMYFLDADQAGRVREFTAELPTKIVRAVDEAIRNLRHATLTWAIGEVGFAVNRRENKEPDVPKLKATNLLKGPVDHDVPVLAVRDGTGKLTAVVFGYACHATVMGYQKWSGDYPGFAMKDLEEAHPGAVALFWAGCGGDQNPLPRREVALAKDYGKQLADAVEKVLVGSMKPLRPEWAGVYEEFGLAFGDLPTREQLTADAQAKDKYIANRAQMLLAKLDKQGWLDQTYPYPVEIWRLGEEVTWVMLGGEVTVEYSLRIKKEIDPGATWVMGYANDVMAYIPSRKVVLEDQDEKRPGRYEGLRSMTYYGQPCAWAPRIEQSIMEAVYRNRKIVEIQR
jgi:hypothetical protein